MGVWFLWFPSHLYLGPCPNVCGHYGFLGPCHMCALGIPEIIAHRYWEYRIGRRAWVYFSIGINIELSIKLVKTSCLGKEDSPPTSDNLKCLLRSIHGVIMESSILVKWRAGGVQLWPEDSYMKMNFIANFWRHLSLWLFVKVWRGVHFNISIFWPKSLGGGLSET